MTTTKSAKAGKTLIPSPFRSRITCPHCGISFAPGDVLWISEHPALMGDDKLGENEQKRFLPTRFDVNGQAIDVKGVTCHELACPDCHLPIPRAIIELDSVIISTLGAPSSGKSYFLASMIHRAQEAALRYFQSNLADVDPVANEVVNSYLNKLFRNSQPGDLVNLNKTQETGPQYSSLSVDQRDIWLAKPFIYSLQPLAMQDERMRRQLCRAICLYDNAGEHFMPGKTANRTATQHLTHSRVLLFLFDPLQHAGFRQACLGRAADPQLGKHGKNNPQDQVIAEAARRIRTSTGLAQHAKYSRPLIVVVTKYDVWHSLLGDEILDLKSLLCTDPTRGITALDLKRLQRLSKRTQALVHEYAPDIAAAAEGFSDEVFYLPNSALGCSPETIRLAGGEEALGVRPCNIRPRLAELPLLYALHRAVPTLIPGHLRTGDKDSSAFVPVVEAPRPPSRAGAKIARDLAEQRLAQAQSHVARNGASPPAAPQTAIPPSPQPRREVALSEAPGDERTRVETYLKESGS